MMIAGAVTLLASLVAAASSHAVGAYWTGLVLLGVGWNLLFVGATVLLTRSYAPAERFRAQGLNDVAVFGSQALASLASGRRAAPVRVGRDEPRGGADSDARTRAHCQIPKETCSDAGLTSPFAALSASNSKCLAFCYTSRNPNRTLSCFSG